MLRKTNGIYLVQIIRVCCTSLSGVVDHHPRYAGMELWCRPAMISIGGELQRHGPQEGYTSRVRFMNDWVSEGNKFAFDLRGQHRLASA